MGYPGNIIVICRGKTVTLYNHWESQWDGLGYDLVNELYQLLSENTLEQLKDKFASLKVVTEEAKPTEAELKVLDKYGDCLCHPPKPITSYRQLLHKCQGSLIKTLESGYMVDTEAEGYTEYTLDLDRGTFGNKHMQFELAKYKKWDLDRSKLFNDE